MLANEGFKHLLLGRRAGLLFVLEFGQQDCGSFFDMFGEIGPVTQMAAAAHHCQIDAGAPTLQLDGEDVDIAVAA